MSKRTCGIVLGLGVGLVGCHGVAGGGAGAPGEDHPGYVLLDRAARQAGYTLEGVQAKAGSPLPVEIEAATPVDLVGNGRRLSLVAEPNELIHVHGASANLEFRHVGQEVDPDRIHVSATDAAAKELSSVLAGSLEQLPDGTWAIAAASALAESSRVRAPTGLLELLPADLVDDAAPGAGLLPGAPGSGSGSVAVGAGAGSASSRPGALYLGFEGGEGTGRARTPHEVLLNVETNLPPAVTCADPATGVWMSQQHDARYSDWYVFTLYVRHVDGKPTALTGEITAQTWLGGVLDTNPPACEGEHAESRHNTIAMSGEGSTADGKLTFGGTSWHTDKVFCGATPGTYDYNLDHFSGVVLNGGTQFEAVNNDGGRMVDGPTSFRRVACQ